MQFVKETAINATPERVFAFHELPDAFERLLPPWENLKIIQTANISKVGSRAIVEQRILGVIRIRWVAEHTRYEPPRLFEDVQVSGPFAKWRHEHLVLVRSGVAILRDEIEFEAPCGVIGRVAAPFLIIPRLERMFEFRHRVTREWAEKN